MEGFKDAKAKQQSKEKISKSESKIVEASKDDKAKQPFNEKPSKSGSKNMDASKNDKAKQQSKEKAKVRRWVLKAVEDVEGDKGATAHYIQKFLDSKEKGISSRPEWKLILKKLLDSGHLRKNGGRYAIRKSKKTSVKGSKGPVANKANKKVAKKQRISIKQ